MGSHIANDDPVVAYISKMVAIPQSELPENKRRGGALTAEQALELGRRKRAEIARARSLAGDERNMDDLTAALDSAEIDRKDEAGTESEERPQDPERLIGFARIFSGTLKVGDEVYVLPPKFSPANPQAVLPKRVNVTALYMIMGRGFEPLTSVSAGMVFGVAGLGGHILKSGTICSQIEGAVNLAGVNTGSQPIVRVALEPANPGDLDKLISGMQMLEQSDPCAEYHIMESGEHVISTAGELHLERCLKDLRERFARCEIQVSEPIIPYRETIVSGAEMASPRDKELPRGTVVGVSTSKQITVRLRVRPMPIATTEFLVKHAATIRRFYSSGSHTVEDDYQNELDNSSDDNSTNDLREDGRDRSVLSSEDFAKELEKTLEEAKADPEVWGKIPQNTIAFGPRRVGPNILVDATKSACCRKLSVIDQIARSCTVLI